MTQQLNPQQQTPSTPTNTEQDWLNTDISCLDEYEPYEWGDIDPLTVGKPIKYDPQMGYIVEDNDNNG